MGEALAKQRAPVELVRLSSGRAVSPVGWKPVLAYKHLLDEHEEQQNPSRQYCDPGHLARTMFQRNTPENQRKVRERINKLFNHCLAQGHFLVIEYDDLQNGKIVAFKLASRGDGEAVKQAAKRQLARMERRKELSAEKLQAARDLAAATFEVAIPEA